MVNLKDDFAQVGYYVQEVVNCIQLSMYTYSCILLEKLTQI